MKGQKKGGREEKRELRVQHCFSFPLILSGPSPDPEGEQRWEEDKKGRRGGKKEGEIHSNSSPSPLRGFFSQIINHFAAWEEEVRKKKGRKRWGGRGEKKGEHGIKLIPYAKP